MKFAKTLSTRLVMLVLWTTIPLVALFLISAVLMARDAVTQTTENLESSASLVAVNQQRVADSVQQVLTAMSHVPDLVGSSEPFCQRYFKTLITELPIYTNLGIIGIDGYIRCHSEPNNPKMFVGDRPYFHSAMASGDFVTSGYWVGRVSGKPVIYFALPVKGVDGSPQAVVFAAVLLSEVAKNIASASLSESTHVVIMDRDGVVLATNPDNAAQLGKPVPNAGIREAIKAGVASVFEGTDASGARRIYAFRPSSTLPNPPFFVVVSADRSEVLAPARQRLVLKLLALALITLLGSWMAWRLAGRAIVKPAVKILEATGRIQTGALDTRIPVRVGDAENELTRIASGFNSMADSLQQREQEQAKSYATLRRTQNRLLAAQKLGRIGHWELDMRSNRLTWSDELHDLFGLNPGDFDGEHTTFLKMIHPDDLARYEEQRSDAYRNGTSLEIEYRIITPAGDVRWMYQFGQLQADETEYPLSRTGLVQDITARKKSELALAHSTRQLQRTGEMARIGGWEVNLETNTAEWSDELTRIFELEPGHSVDWTSGINFYEPEAQQVLRAAIREAIKHATPWDLELPFITAKGRRIWIRCQGQAVVTNGWATNLVGTMQDVTVQHDSRQHLRLLENAVSRLNDIVLITEAEPVEEPGPRIVYVNDAFEKHTGYSRDEALGRSPRFLQGPNTQPKELQRITQALKAWQPVRSELINYTKTGEEFWVELEIVPIANALGWFTHWVSVQRDITQRKAAEKALTDSEQRYAALFDKAPIPMWVYDTAEHRFLTVNEAAVETYGYSADEFQSMTIFDICEQSRQIWQQNHKLELPAPGSCWQHRRKNGSFLTVNSAVKPIQYAGRDAWFVVASDITARLYAEQEVQKQIFTLQRATDAAYAIAWHQTIEGMLHEAAEQARGVIGTHQCVVSLTLAHGLSRGISELSVSGKYTEYKKPHDLPDGADIYATVCENNRAARMTQAELEAHPRWRDFQAYADNYPAMHGWLAVPLTGRDGQRIGLMQLSDKYEGEFTLQDEYVAIELAQLVSIAIENTRLLEEVRQLNAGLEQKVAERTLALARQEALFRALAEQAPQVIWTADNKGDTTYLNRAWFDLVGGTPEDWSGRKWLSAIHPQDIAKGRKNWLHAAATRSAFVGIRRLLGQDGSYHVMSYRALPVFDEHGEVSFWVGIDADITEIKSIESALRLSNQELEAFSYSVSHDLRAPLNTIDGFSRLLAKQIKDDAGSKAQHYLTRIQAGVAQMGKLIEDLLSLAQVSRMELRRELVDLSVLSRRILADWQGRAPDRHVEFHIQPDLVAQGDASLLRVLMENLLGNAWKFTSQRDPANITVGQQPDVAGSPVFFVRDDGAGFDMAYADKLFVAFQRLHLASEFPGNGVGLATVGRVIGRHGGQLWADASPGNGATFFFTLPKMPAAP